MTNTTNTKIENYLYPQHWIDELGFTGRQLESINKQNDLVRKCFKNPGKVYKWCAGSYWVVDRSGDLIQIDYNDEAGCWVAHEANNKWYWSFETKKEAVSAVLVC